MHKNSVNSVTVEFDTEMESQEKMEVLYISPDLHTLTRMALADKLEEFFQQFSMEHPERPFTDATPLVIQYLSQLEDKGVSIVDDTVELMDRGKLHILASYHSGMLESFMINFYMISKSIGYRCWF